VTSDAFNAIAEEQRRDILALLLGGSTGAPKSVAAYKPAWFS
jgi:hypothetical protein